VLIPVFAIHALGMGVGTYGALLSAEGAGAIIGGAIIASRRDVRHQGLLALAAGLVDVFALSVPLFFVIGMSQITFQATNNGAIFAETPAHLRGRVIGVRNQTRGLVPVSHLAAGAMADFAGVSVAFPAIGGLTLLVLWAVQLWTPGLRKVCRELAEARRRGESCATRRRDRR